MPKPPPARSPRTSPFKNNRPEGPKLQAPAAEPAPLFLDTQPPLSPLESVPAQPNAPAEEDASAVRDGSTTLEPGAAKTRASKLKASRKAAREPMGAATQGQEVKARVRSGPGLATGFPWEMAAPALFAGAVLAGGLGAPPEGVRYVAPRRRAAEPVRILPVVPPAETWVVKPRAAFSFVSLQGRLSRGAVIEGHVALAGEVSRVLVREGQHVDVGDRVLTLKTESESTTVRSIPRVQARQSQAEGQQVQAVRRKEALEERIAQAHTDYAEAQARLDSANKKLADSRATLKRVSMGQAVPNPSASSPRERPRAARASRTEGPSRADRGKLERAQSENRAAEAVASRAEDDARAASAKAKSLFSAASSAQSKERQAEGALDSAKAKLKGAQAQLDAGTAKADAVAEARASVSQAESELEGARKKSQSAVDESQSAQSEAEQARSKASRASERVAESLHDLKAAQSQAQAREVPNSRPQAEEREPSRPTARGTLSVSAAVRTVREAMSEASSAASNAERLKTRVEGFKSSASTISGDMQASAHNIEQAQEQVLDTTVQASLSTLRAPASGTVLSVASVGEGVSVGQAVVRVANGPQGLEATLEDLSGAWKQLRPEMTLPGRLLSTPLSGAGARANGIEGGAQGTVTLGQSPLRLGMPILLKVREVEPPAQAGGAARIRVAVVPGSSPRVQPQDNMAVAISLSKGSSDLLSIPAIAVARGAGSQPMVGVLREVSQAAEPSQATASGTPEGSAAPRPGASDDVPALDSPKAPPQVLEAARAKPEAKPTRERLFEIEWRPVSLSDALPAGLSGAKAETAGQGEELGIEKMKKVISGLEPGERILRDASQWQGRFVSTPGKPVRVRLALDLG